MLVRTEAHSEPLERRVAAPEVANRLAKLLLLSGTELEAKFLEGGRVCRVTLPTAAFAQALVVAHAGGRCRWVRTALPETFLSIRVRLANLGNMRTSAKRFDLFPECGR